MNTKLRVLQTHLSEDKKDNTQHVSTSGEVRVRPMPKHSPTYSSKGYFTLQVFTSDPNLRTQTSYDVDSQTLSIRTPQQEDLQSDGPHCISIELTAWIPEGAEFDTVNIETIELSQRLFNGLSLNVNGESSFKSVTGSVHRPQVDESNPIWSKNPTRSSWDDEIEEDWPAKLGEKPEIPLCNFASRRTTVKIISGGLTGVWPLYDYLSINVISGPVNIAVEPREIDPKAPSPAELIIDVISGFVQVQMPIHSPESLPPRRYTTHVSLYAGSIHGQFITGHRGYWRTTSGSINLELLPMIEVTKDGSQSALDTSTVDSPNHVKLLDPIFLLSEGSVLLEDTKNSSSFNNSVDANEPYILTKLANLQLDKSTNSAKTKLHSLVSSHQSVSGSVNVTYPDAWEGLITAQSLNGDIQLEADDVEIIHEERRDHLRRELVARKPKGADYEKMSSVTLYSTSGDIIFTV
jgi:hypothetical protein